MAENTSIEWADHTWNPWIGCTKVGPACDHCYAEELMDTRYGRVEWGAGRARVRTAATTWDAPRKWNRAAAKAGRIDTVFCLSLGDIWDNEVDPGWREDAVAVMEETPSLLWLLLSKRIGNAVKMAAAMPTSPPLPPNVALGATMANQEEWDRDLPKLLEAARILRPRFTFASVEPMLGPISTLGDFPDWVICGGESGPRARPMHPDWPRGLRDDCQAAGVPFFFKQWGEWVPQVGAVDGWEIDDNPEISRFDHRDWKGDHFGEPYRPMWDQERDGDTVSRIGKKAAGRLLDGIEHNGMPEIRR